MRTVLALLMLVTALPAGAKENCGDIRPVASRDWVVTVADARRRDGRASNRFDTNS